MTKTLNVHFLHPGELLKDEIVALYVKDVAAKTAIDLALLEDILEGGSPMTEEVAKAIEPIFGIPSGFWLRLQNRYDQRIALLEDEQHG